jgi:predicted DNA-binding mobile mystery protein A
MDKFTSLREIPMPPKGWLRAVRDALGMNGRQFAARLGVSPVRITRLESDEVAGALSLNTLRNAAEALDCVLVYGLMPKTSLDDTVKHQAIGKAKERLASTSHTMALEAQERNSYWQEHAFNELVEKMIQDQPKNFWNK